MNAKILDVNPQRVIIHVVDVDEPPAFVNGQKPFLAVVSLNPPKTGLNVFQFMARDENGDGDSDVEYRLINTERKRLVLNCARVV